MGVDEARGFDMTDIYKCGAAGSGSVLARFHAAHLLGPPAIRIRRIWQSYWERRARRALVLLRTLDKHTLDDIGLTADDIERALAEFDAAARHRSSLARIDARAGLQWPSERSLWGSR
jgi:uncharacterized protein YjiS (DUF1127 family)